MFENSENMKIEGASYYAPEVFTSGVYNLYFIGVLPHIQPSGVGSKLFSFVENHLK